MVAGQSPAEIFSLHDINPSVETGLAPSSAYRAPKCRARCETRQATSLQEVRCSLTTPRRRPSQYSEAVSQATQPSAPELAPPLPVRPAPWPRPGLALPTPPHPTPPS